MAGNTEWTRTRRTTALSDVATASLDGQESPMQEGPYRLEWLDEAGNVLCSKELEISGVKDEDGIRLVIDMNYRLMTKEHPELFVMPIDDDAMAAIEAEMQTEYEEGLTE